MKKVFNGSLYILNGLYLFFTLLTAMASIRSSLFEPQILTAIALYLFLGLLILSISLLVSRKMLTLIKTLGSFFEKNQKSVLIIYTVLLFIVQLFLISQLNADIGWDVSRIFKGVEGILVYQDHQAANDYLSMNPNNSFYFFFMFGLSKLANLLIEGLGTSWFFWSLVNVVIWNLGFIALFFACKKLFSSKLARGVYFLSSLSISLSPWIIVPYTDSLAFTLLSILFLLYTYLRNSTYKSKKAVFLTNAIGFVLGIAYLNKPTSLIVVVAWMMLALLRLFKPINFKLKDIIILLTIAIVSGSAVVGTYQTFNNRQSIVTYDETKAKVWPLFIMMGLKDDGGYNGADTYRIVDIPDKEEKMKVSLDTIKERLNQFTVEGYIDFLFSKHSYNVADGDFGWGKDGVEQVPQHSSANKMQHYLRDTFYQQGSRVTNLKFYMQNLWVFTCVGLLMAAFIGKKSMMTYLFKLTLIGLFIYLLIFEGGRSRYLIQMLPIIYTLSILGWGNVFKTFQNKANR